MGKNFAEYVPVLLICIITEVKQKRTPLNLIFIGFYLGERLPKNSSCFTSFNCCFHYKVLRRENAITLLNLTTVIS